MAVCPEHARALPLSTPLPLSLSLTDLPRHSDTRAPVDPGDEAVEVEVGAADWSQRAAPDGSILDSDWTARGRA